MINFIKNIIVITFMIATFGLCVILFVNDVSLKEYVESDDSADATDDIETETIDDESPASEIEQVEVEPEIEQPIETEYVDTTPEINNSVGNTDEHTTENEPIDNPVVEENNDIVETYRYENCTDLKKDFPGGVSIEHPAYEPKMDGNNDGWACDPPR